MNGRFAKGVIVGSIIGASISMMMDPDMMKARNRRRMIRNGRNFIRKSGHIINDIVDVFR